MLIDVVEVKCMHPRAMAPFCVKCGSKIYEDLHGKPPPIVYELEKEAHPEVVRCMIAAQGELN